MQAAGQSLSWGYNVGLLSCAYPETQAELSLGYAIVMQEGKEHRQELAMQVSFHQNQGALISAHITDQRPARGQWAGKIHSSYRKAVNQREKMKETKGTESLLREQGSNN